MNLTTDLERYNNENNKIKSLEVQNKSNIANLNQQTSQNYQKSNKTENLKKLLKIVLPVFLIPLCLLLVVIILISFINTPQNNSNSQNQNSTLQNNSFIFVIIDGNKNTIPNAVVEINRTKRYTSDSNGIISMGLEEINKNNTLQIKIMHPNYELYDESISIQSNTNQQVIQLTDKGLYSVSGTFTSKSVDKFYTFSEDTLKINDKKIKISKNGSFRLSNIKDSKITLTLESNNFEDINKSFILKKGENNLSSIELSPKGDIEGKLFNYINDEEIKDFLVDVEGILSSKVEKTDNTFRIKDLDINREYVIRIRADGYSIRTYNIKVNQGLNSIPNLKMVPLGKVAFIKAVDKVNTLFIADFDGENEEVILSKRNLLISNRYIKDQKELIFTSTHENLHRSRSGFSTPIYRYDLEAKQIERITNKNLQSMNNIYVNLKSNIIVVYEIIQKQGQVNLYSIKGDFLETIYETKNEETFMSAIISPKSTNVFFVIKSGNLYSLYSYNTESKSVNLIEENQNIELEAINENGNILIYSKRSTNNKFSELVAYYLNENKFVVIRQNINAKNIRFLDGSDNIILFINERAGRTNISQIDLNTNIEKVFLNYNQPEKLNYFYQQDEYIIYANSTFEYIFEISKPKLNKVLRRL